MAVATRLPFALAAFLAPFLFFSDSVHSARAGDDERLIWGLGDDSYRLDLEEDVAQRVTDDPGSLPALDKLRLISAADFDWARRLRGDVRDSGDVLWYYALLLPDGEFGAKGGTAPIDDTWKLPPGMGQLHAHGQDEVRKVGGGKTMVRAQVDFEQEKIGARAGATIVKGSQLTVERTYLDKKKLIVEAHFELTVHRQDGQVTHVTKQVGTIRLSGKVDTAAKQFLSEVQGAIKRGVGFLEQELNKRLTDFKTQKTPPNNALGLVALPTFALLRSGVEPGRLKAAFDYMGACDWRETYSVSLYVMCLEARSVRREEVPAAVGAHTVARFRKDAVPKQDQEELARAARWLIAVRKHGEGWWSYRGDPGEALSMPVPQAKGTTEKKKLPDGKNPDDEGFPLTPDGSQATGGDRSNSQFATLALHSAFTSVDPSLLDPTVWKEIVDELAIAQEGDGPPTSLQGIEWTAAAPAGIAPDGGADPFQPNATRSKDSMRKDYGEGARSRGWAYAMHGAANNGAGYGSMSGAGLSSSCVAREALRRAGKLDPEAEAKTRNQIRDGVAWFLNNWTPVHNPKNGGWYYYYLYSVEKAMETAGIEKLGPHEWWREGSAQLLSLEDNQTKKQGGSWNGGNVEDTSFALLFLNRATLPATIQTQDQIKIATGDKDPDAWDQVFVEGTGHVRLRQVFYALETATPDLVRDRVKIADKGFELLEEDRRPRLIPDLIRLASLADKDIRRFALHALQVAAGTPDAAKAQKFYVHWQELARACEERDYSRIAVMRALFKDPDSLHPLRRTICVALTRLRGVEALGELIAELSDKDASYRRQVATTLVQLAGGEKAPYDPTGSDADQKKGQASWLEWWQKSQADLVFAEEARRHVEALASDASRSDAQAKLRQMGKRATRALVDGLTDPRTKPHAYALLKELTGQSLAADDSSGWLAWLDKQPR
jgi:hypothetical protein